MFEKLAIIFLLWIMQLGAMLLSPKELWGIIFCLSVITQLINGGMN